MLKQIIQELDVLYPDRFSPETDQFKQGEIYGAIRVIRFLKDKYLAEEFMVLPKGKV